MTEQTTAAEPWRIGSHYKIHVYAGDRPVATFHRAEEAARAVEAVNARPFPNAPGDHDASPTSSGPALASSIAAEPAVTKTGIDSAPTPPAPSGLVDAVRSYLAAVDMRNSVNLEMGSGVVGPANDAVRTARATLDATLSGQQGGAVPAGDLMKLRGLSAEAQQGRWHTNENHKTILGEPTEDDETLFYDVARAPYRATRSGDAWRQWMADKAFIVAAVNFVRACLAEQPAAAGTGDADPATLYARRLTISYTNWRGEFGRREIAPIRLFWGSNEWHPEPQWLIEAWDIGKAEIRAFALNGIGGTGAHGVEGLWPGLKKALEIVRAEMETASSSSGSYQRLGSVGLALRAALDGASGRGEKAGDAQN